MRGLRRWMGLFGLGVIGLSACGGAPETGDRGSVAGRPPATAIQPPAITAPLPTTISRPPTTSPAASATPLPTDTPTPLPTADSHHPTAGPFPAPPADWRDAPAAIAAWLNAAPDNPPRITALIDEWHTVLDANGDLSALSHYFKQHPARVAVADLDGDGTMEIVITMLARAAATDQSPGPGVRQLMVFYQRRGNYQVVADTLLSQSRADDVPIETYLWRIVDLTGDGRAEIITDTGDCGAHTCFNFPGIWQWSTAGITDVLITGFYSPSADLEPDTANAFAEFSLADEAQDGVQELRVEGGGIGSVGGGIRRRTVAIYAWDGAAYRLGRVEYAADGSEPFWKLIDAGRLFRDGEYAAADEAYRAILAEPQADREGGIPYAAVAQASRFQLMLTSLLLDQPEQARRWRDELAAGGDPDWGDLFWAEYERTGRVRAGCQAAAGYARGFEFAHTGYVNWTADRVTCVFR